MAPDRIGNMLIWQGQTERVPLRPGVVTVSLVTSAELSPPNSAKRNVDAVITAGQPTAFHRACVSAC